MWTRGNDGKIPAAVETRMENQHSADTGAPSRLGTRAMFTTNIDIASMSVTPSKENYELGNRDRRMDDRGRISRLFGVGERTTLSGEICELWWCCDSASGSQMREASVSRQLLYWTRVCCVTIVGRHLFGGNLQLKTEGFA